MRSSPPSPGAGTRLAIVPVRPPAGRRAPSVTARGPGGAQLVAHRRQRRDARKAGPAAGGGHGGREGQGGRQVRQAAGQRRGGPGGQHGREEEALVGQGDSRSRGRRPAPHARRAWSHGDRDPSVGCRPEDAQGAGPQPAKEIPEVDIALQLVAGHADQVRPANEGPRRRRPGANRVSRSCSQDPLPGQRDHGPGSDGRPTAGELVGDRGEVPRGSCAPRSRQRRDRQPVARLVGPDAPAGRVLAPDDRAGRQRNEMEVDARLAQEVELGRAGGRPVHAEDGTDAETEAGEEQGAVGGLATQAPAPPIGWIEDPRRRTGDDNGRGRPVGRGMLRDRLPRRDDRCRGRRADRGGREHGPRSVYWA